MYCFINTSSYKHVDEGGEKQQTYTPYEERSNSYIVKYENDNKQS